MEGGWLGKPGLCTKACPCRTGEGVLLGVLHCKGNVGGDEARLAGGVLEPLWCFIGCCDMCRFFREAIKYILCIHVYLNQFMV